MMGNTSDLTSNNRNSGKNIYRITAAIAAILVVAAAFWILHQGPAYILNTNGTQNRSTIGDQDTSNVLCPCINESQFQHMMNESDNAEVGSSYYTNYSSNSVPVLATSLDNSTWPSGKEWESTYRSYNSVDFGDYGLFQVNSSTNASNAYVALINYNEKYGLMAEELVSTGAGTINGLNYSYFQNVEPGTGISNRTLYDYSVFGYKSDYYVALELATNNLGVESFNSIATQLANLT